MSERKPLIWIVDDSATEGAITRHSLGSSYDYEYFEDGSIVVEKLTTSRAQPDLLILDWVMPGMHGDDVCRFLRSHEPTKDLPIIITTASRVETSDIVTGLASGADDYVARPFAAEELRARVNAALRSRELAEMSKRERRRLAAVNRLAQALLHATDVRGVLDALAFVLVGGLCDGCGILLLPGQAHEVSLARHRSGSATAVAAITNVTDPCVRAFESNEDARAQLPAAYKPYIDQLGLSGLAVLALPESSPLQGVITLTRDGTSAPFDFDDISTVETCIEYCSLAIQNALRVDADRVARAQLDATLQSLPVGIMVTDARGRMTLVNAAAAALLPGISQAKDVGEVFALAGWYNLDGTPVSGPRWEPGQPLTAARRQLLLHAAGQPPRAVTVSTVPLLDTREGAVTVIEDISAERAVAVERERVSRFQEEMVAIVGHDLRAPLGAFIAGTDLLQSIAIDHPPLSPVVDRLRRSGHRMTKIVEQLLDVTHARLGKGIPLDVRKNSLRTVIESVIAESALTNPKTSFEIIAPNDVVGLWDADRMAQVVSNLANNAAHYGRPGGPVIVELTATADTATIVVKNPVRDKPIPPELLGVLFDPFQRGRQSGNLGGLGLGLYIVREVVQAHGGTIEVTSDAETIFRVILPRERSQARPALIT